MTTSNSFSVRRIHYYYCYFATALFIHLQWCLSVVISVIHLQYSLPRFCASHPCPIVDLFVFIFNHCLLFLFVCRYFIYLFVLQLLFYYYLLPVFFLLVIYYCFVLNFSSLLLTFRFIFTTVLLLSRCLFISYCSCFYLNILIFVSVVRNVTQQMTFHRSNSRKALISLVLFRRLCKTLLLRRQHLRLLSFQG